MRLEPDEPGTVSLDSIKGFALALPPGVNAVALLLVSAGAYPGIPDYQVQLGLPPEQVESLCEQLFAILDECGSVS